MLAGHFGLAALVKAQEPQLPLWSLMLSTQLLDVLFVPALLLGYESLENVPGTNGGYGQFIIHADYTHSLVGALVISLVAMLVAMVPWGRRNGLIIGAVVFSHWILDLLVHRPDMPLLPGNAGNLPLLGLGLWQIPLLTALIELALVLVGAFLYYHAAMRSAIRAERLDAKEGKAPSGLRQQALYISILMAVLLVGTLAADYFGLGG
jgi:hypothetical protein